MTRPRAAKWCRRHVETLLTAATLPIALAISAPGSHWPSDWRIGLTVLAWLPLTVRTRWPLPVAAVVVLLDAVHIAVAAHAHPAAGLVPAASMLALYTVSVRCSARAAWSSAIVAAALQYTVAALSPRHDLGPDLLYLNWALVAAAVGRLVRERQERIEAAEQRADAAERSKASEARRQVMDERVRIARELHDVLAHHITVVNAQAGVAHYLLKSDPDTAEKALAGIIDNTRAALDDLRATLGVLRSDRDDTSTGDLHSPAPALSQLPALVDSFTGGGAAITFRSHGTPRPLSGPAELGLYRIAQEALTNAAKHAPGSVIELTLGWTDSTVSLRVTNTKPPAPSPRPAAGGTGHGLIGMQERASAADGILTAGPTSEGGYHLAVTLPVISARDGHDQAPGAATVAEAP